MEPLQSLLEIKEKVLYLHILPQSTSWYNKVLPKMAIPVTRCERIHN